MTSPKLLLPLRVPELGPSLGKLVTGSGRDPGSLGLDAIRFQLVTRMIESAGEARRLAGSEERSAAIFALSPVFWLTAWEETVNAVAGALTDRVSSRINQEADLEVVAETGDGQQAADLWKKHRPDITLMDLRMPGLDGVNAIYLIRAAEPNARIIVLTTYDGDEIGRAHV